MRKLDRLVTREIMPREKCPFCANLEDSRCTKSRTVTGSVLGSPVLVGWAPRSDLNARVTASVT